MTKTMARHGWWRDEYRRRRYLEHAAGGELNQRFQDIISVLCDLTAEGKIAFKSRLNEDIEVMRRLTHVLEELSLRGEEPDSSILNGSHFTGRRYVNAKRAAQVWMRAGITAGDCLYKFGRVKFLKSLCRVGSFRVAPASYYNDKLLNSAIHDSELEFTEEFYGARVRHPPGGDYSIPRNQWTDMPIVGNVKSTRRPRSDYYIACFSSSYEYRLYDDFDADACLVIKDAARFEECLRVRMTEFLPGWELVVGAVDYRDPLFPEREMNVNFCKHFRFAYQKEVRFVWEPPAIAKGLRCLHLELGPLHEYCELLVL